MHKLMAQKVTLKSIAELAIKVKIIRDFSKI